MLYAHQYSNIIFQSCYICLILFIILLNILIIRDLILSISKCKLHATFFHETVLKSDVICGNFCIYFLVLVLLYTFLL